MTLVGGWGQSPWGAGQWGSGSHVFSLLAALAVRENVLRLQFSEVPLYTQRLDPHDASNADRYVITPVANTMHGNGTPRAVLPIIAEVSDVDAAGHYIDVTVDRPFDGYPGQYDVAVNHLLSTESGLIIDSNTAYARFYGLARKPVNVARDLAVPSRDIANPQTRAALLDPLPVTTVGTLLGSIPTDSNGDFAFDEGITNYKKRLFRRMVTRKGAFGHAPGYGLGLPDQLKHLARASVRSRLASEAQQQAMEEPESMQASATWVAGPVAGVWILRLKARTKMAALPINLDVPFAPIGD